MLLQVLVGFRDCEAKRWPMYWKILYGPGKTCKRIGRQCNLFALLPAPLAGPSRVSQRATTNQFSIPFTLASQSVYHAVLGNNRDPKIEVLREREFTNHSRVYTLQPASSQD